MTTRRWLRLALGTAAVLLLVQIATYLLFADGARPRTIVRYLPERLRRGAHDSAWVCVSEDTWSALRPYERQAMDDALKARVPVVYHATAEIPPEMWVYAPGRTEAVGVKFGCIMEWQCTARAPFLFTVHAGYYVGGTGAEYRKETYFWVLAGWVRVWTHYLEQA